MSTSTTEDLNGFAHRDSSISQNIKSDLQEVGSQALCGAKKLAQDCSEAGMETFEKYSKEGKRQLAKAENYVQKNPVQTVLLCAAAGILISRFLRSFK